MTKDQKKKWWKSLFLEEKDKGYQFSFTKFFVVLFVLSNVALYLDVTPIGIPNLFFYVYIFSLCTLYVPIIYMTFYICFWMKTSASPSSAQTLFRQASENHSDFDDDETHLNETNSIERAADQGID